MSHIELIPASRRLPPSPQAVQRAMERAEATQFEGDVRFGFATASNHLAVLAKEVERLQAIVGQLEQTADCVPVVPGMVLFSREGERYSPILSSGFAVRARYSTREAAMASLEQTQPENTEGKS